MGGRVFSSVPEQADLLLIGGPVLLIRMLPVLRRPTNGCPSRNGLLLVGLVPVRELDHRPGSRRSWWVLRYLCAGSGYWLLRAYRRLCVPGCPPQIEDLIDTIAGLQRNIASGR